MSRPARVAVVVGGGRGIGLAIALRLEQDGCRVVMTSREPRAARSGLDCVYCDVRDPGAVLTAFAAVRANHGTPSIVVVNTAARDDRPMALLSEAAAGVTVNVVMPGLVDTDLTADLTPRNGRASSPGSRPGGSVTRPRSPTRSDFWPVIGWPTSPAR